MVHQIAIAAGMLGMLFILFLVISKSIGVIDNTLYKLEYLVRKECDIQLESLEFKYRMRTASQQFDEVYGTRHFSDEIQKAADGNG
jgi:hypothetical protein